MMDVRPTKGVFQDALCAFHRITIAHEMGFDEQLGRVIELGCEWLKLDCGMIVDRTCGPARVVSFRSTDKQTDDEELHECCRALMDEADGQSFDSQSFICFPVLVSGQEYGAIGFAGRERNSNCENQDVEIIQLFAQWIGAEIGRRRTQADHDRLFQLSLDMLFVGDTEGFVLRINPAFERLLGHSTTALFGRPLTDFVHEDDRNHVANAFGSLSSGERTKGLECRFRCHDGSYKWINLTAVPSDDGRMFFAVARDVTERKQFESDLRHAAMHDKLTGLPNRSLFNDRLNQVMKRAKRNQDLKFAVLFLDFDQFKIINDSLGHEIGDALLIEIADRLESNIRSTDSMSRRARQLPARLGGDEFVVLIDDIHDFDNAMFVAQRLQKVLSVPFNLQGHTIVTTASIGIVTNEQDYESAEDILRDADTAMYHAKQSGRAQCAVFDDTMRQDVLNRLKVERDLHEAITHEQFEAHYQPIVSLDTAMLTGFEALIRWSHPGMGRVAPEQFIEIAEDIGLIVPIGYWMIRQGCHQLKQWELRHESLTMGINLSKRQLMQPDLIERVGNIIADTGIDPRRLKFDITESAITDERNDPSETLDELRGMGIELCMDDFGSGLSSLSCIHEYPIDIIKIDHAFLKHLAVNREYAALVQAIITLAHTLDMRVVAEGVETRSQLLQLQALECDMAQGFLFSNPVCASRATELLDTSSFAQLLQPERGSRSA